MFVRIRRQNTNPAMYLTLKWRGNLQEIQIVLLSNSGSRDGSFSYDNRWRLIGNKIIPVAFPDRVLTIVYATGKLTLSHISNSIYTDWEFPGAPWRQIKRSPGNTDSCIDGNVKDGSEVFMHACANRVNHQWFYEFSVPDIPTQGYSLGRILNQAVVRFVFRERQLIARTVGGTDRLHANTPFVDAASPADQFLLQQVGPKDRAEFLIKSSNGHYLNASGDRILSSQLRIDDSSFRFRIVPATGGTYNLQSLRPSGGYLCTANDMWSGDNLVYITPDLRGVWSQILIDVISQTDYAALAKRGADNPKWCCGVEFGDDPTATQACEDLGYVPAEGNCDNWMAKFCNKHPDDPACACLKSDIPIPQCLDARCSNNPRAYKNRSMLGECKNLTYTDCRQIGLAIGQTGADTKINIDNNTYTQMCGNVLAPDQPLPVPGGGGQKNTSESEGLSSAQWIFIIIGILILMIVVGLIVYYSTSSSISQGVATTG